MRYRVIVPKKVQKNLKRIDKRYRVRILAALVALGGDPYLGKKLEGKFAREWSYMVWPYRIVYEIKQKALVVIVIRAGHGQGGYKRR